MRKRIVLVLSFCFFIHSLASAQVTTSSVSGTVSSGKELLPGASITITHLPTGTVFHATSQTQGVFNFVNLIPGGPYKIDASFVGFQNFVQDSVFLPLGENTRVDIALNAATARLQEVIVTGTSSSRKKTGASTNINRQMINALPTLSRSIQDYTRLTPQANGNSLEG